MSDIKVITPPDIIFDQSFKIVLINPNPDIKKYIEEELQSAERAISVYVFDNNDIKWLLTLCKLADKIILDIKDDESKVSHFYSYILSFPNTYYRCEHLRAPWSLLNVNRFFDVKAFDKLL